MDDTKTENITHQEPYDEARNQDLLSPEVRIFYDFSKLTNQEPSKEYCLDSEGLLEWNLINNLLKLPSGIFVQFF